MTNCTCYSTERRKLYEPLLDASARFAGVPNELLKPEIWSHWFGFNAAQAFRSFLHRFRLAFGEFKSERAREQAMLWAMAQTLVVGLDIDRIEAAGILGTRLQGPRGELEDDKSILESLAYKEDFSDEVNSLCSELLLIGRCNRCDGCNRQLRKFLRFMNRLWQEGFISLNDIYQDEVLHFPISNRKATLPIFLSSTPNSRTGHGGLTELGMAETLEAHSVSILYRLWQAMVTLPTSEEANAGSSLFHLLFTKNGGDMPDPWAFNIIFRKSEAAQDGRPGFGYILTDRQIESIEALASSSPNHRKIESWDIYEKFKRQQDKALGRLIEAVWQLHRFDGFIRDGSGLMRIPFYTNLPVVIPESEYEPLVKESPIRPLEVEVMHCPWAIEVPLYERTLNLQREGEFDHQGSFRAVGWLMSYHRLPPFVRLAFLDAIQSNESILVSWIKQFATHAQSIRKSVAKAEELKWLYHRKHNLLDATATLKTLRSTMKKMDAPPEVKQDIDTQLRWAITNISTGEELPKGVTLKMQLEEVIKTAFELRDLPLEGQVVSALDSEVIDAIPTDLQEQVLEATLTLVKNSAKAFKGFGDKPDDQRPPYMFQLSVLDQSANGSRAITLEARDTAGGINEQYIDGINGMFEEYLAGWDRNLHVDSDLRRWSCRLQAMFDKDKPITLDPIRHQGWYGLMAALQEQKPTLRISNGLTEGHNGLVVSMIIPFRD